MPLSVPAEMDPHARAESVWYRVAGLLRRKELAIDIVEGEIRSALHEVLLEAERLAVSGISGPSVAKTLRTRSS
jgi:hypothetical protein